MGGGFREYSSDCWNGILHHFGMAPNVAAAVVLRDTRSGKWWGGKRNTVRALGDDRAVGLESPDQGDGLASETDGSLRYLD